MTVRVLERELRLADAAQPVQREDRAERIAEQRAVDVVEQRVAAREVRVAAQGHLPDPARPQARAARCGEPVRRIRIGGHAQAAERQARRPALTGQRHARHLAQAALQVLEQHGRRARAQLAVLLRGGAQQTLQLRPAQ
jgi:hypothetical protein